jgi:predicted DNA-binding protein
MAMCINVIILIKSGIMQEYNLRLSSEEHMALKALSSEKERSSNELIRETINYQALPANTGDTSG